MTTRELFESKFPVPHGVFWQDYRYVFDSQRDMAIAIHHNLLWKGFQAGAKRKQCAWAYDEYEDSWDTGCGNKFSFIDGKPKENGFEFCCYCGGELVEAGDA